MKKIASELLVERLIDWGVEVVFGLPGDGINGIMEGLRRHKDRSGSSSSSTRRRPRAWPPAMPNSTGRLSVCLATSGPGGLHLLNGLYDAKLAPRCPPSPACRALHYWAPTSSRRSTSTGSS